MRQGDLLVLLLIDDFEGLCSVLLQFKPLSRISKSVILKFFFTSATIKDFALASYPLKYVLSKVAEKQ